VLREVFEKGSPRLRNGLVIIPQYVKTERTSRDAIQALADLFAKPPKNARDELLRSLGAVAFDLSKRGANPKPAIEKLLSSSEALDRRAGLIQLTWFADRYPELRARVLELEVDDSDAGVTRAAQAAHQAYERAAAKAQKK
jgi:hypothetical protein